MISKSLSNRHVQQNPKETAFYNNPYGFYKELYDIGGPVYWEEYGFWSLYEFEAVNNALRDSRFARLPPAGHAATKHPAHLNAFAEVERHSLLALEPPQHTRLRKSVNAAFVNRQVTKMEGGIELLANQLIDDFENDSEIDLLARYATPLPVTVIANLLGVPISECNSLLAWSHAMVRVYTLTQTIEEEHAANQASIDFQALLLELIKTKRDKPSDDLISHLAQPGSDALSDEEIVSVAVLLLNAGHEATVHQLGNTVKILLTNDRLKDQPKNWFENTQLSDKIIAEALRFDAPLHLFTRYAQESIELHKDVVIEKGEQIALLLGAANRDPKRFVNADQFVPERTDGAYLSLGAGLHFCVGASLAKIELRVALTALFKRLPNIKLSAEPHYQNSFHFHGLKDLRVNW